MPTLLLPHQSIVLKAFTVLANAAPGATNYTAHTNFIKDVSFNTNTYVSALNQLFASASDASLASLMLNNLGLTSVFTAAEATAFITANAGNRVGAIFQVADLVANYAGTNATALAAKTTLNNKMDFAYNWSVNPVNTGSSNFPATFEAAPLALTAAIETLIGDGTDNTFLAQTANNVNTLQDGDKVVGAAGFDTLIADLNFQTSAITPNLSSIEKVVIRSQQTVADSTNGNNTSSNFFNGLVQIDAQRSLDTDSMNKVVANQGVSWWESNNSRSDVVIEDVRIGNDQKTKDVTIAFVESDPGNVDYGVYFDQQSLRNSSSGSTTLSIRLMDTGAAADAATAATPLLNQPYDQFKLGINGVLTTIQLDKAAVKAADTYAALLTVFQNALAGTGLTVALGANFTVTDPISNKAVTGQTISITGGASAVISTPEGSGWYNTTGASVPATSNIYTTFGSGETSTTELVTSKVVLDDVGRSNLGGDLVIGGMSTGDTSNYSIYRGVERFEIEVRDNSKLQTINSTNNALREVTITSGATSKTVKDAYTTTVTNEGDLVVNGDAAANLALVDTATQIRGQSYVVPAAGTQSGGNNQLPGVENNSPVGVHHGAGAAGFTDVRLIDASEFKGKLGFTAAITQDSIAKYANLIDVAPAAPAADIAANGNVNFGVRGANFIYTGGNDNDTMTVAIDGAAAASRSTVVSGQSDFTFAFNGGAGDDALTVNVINGALAGGAQAWYNNQKLNANIAIGAGDGNDTVRTPGAGDIIIDAGAGNDTVYTDNTGALNATATANGAGELAAVAYTNAAAAELAAAQAARVLSNSTGFVTSDGVPVGTFITRAAQVAALNTLDQITPTNAPALPVITHAALAAGTAAAAAAGAITLAQKVALDAAYNSVTGGVVTPAVGVGGPSTIVGGVAVAGNVTAAELAAGDALLATYLTAAKAAAAAATAADAEVGVQNGFLNGTQLAVVNAYMAINGVDDGTTPGNEIGTANVVSGLAALQSALVNGASQAQAVAAIDVATASGVLNAAGTNAAAVLAAVGAGAMDAADAANVVALLSPLQNAAALANAAATTTYNNAVTADTNAVNTAANIVALDPVAAAADVIANNFVGSTEAATAATNAANASARAAADLAASQAINTALEGLKSAVNVGTLDAGVTNAIANANAAIVAAIASSAANGTAAVTVNPLAAPGVQAALLVLAGVPGSAVDAAEELAFETGALGVFDANSVNSLIAANTVQTDALTIVAANRAATATATATASANAAAAAASGGTSSLVAAPNAVFVFDTSNQSATYNRLTADDRNLADLKSDANNSNNFFNSTLKVSYRGIDASVTVAGTGYKTTDLEINQSIKQAINSDAVLSKLLLATDGPANSLVVTSLIDGAHVTGNLAITVTMPTTVTTADLAGAAAAYGLAAGSTEAQVLAAMTAAKTAFDVKGDYVTQFAESGATAGNTLLVGANGTASTDNTITLGTGNDVLVLSNTVGTDAMTSSNEKVIYAGDFGNDTIVYFAASGLGIDTLDFTALGGRGNVALNSLSADKSIVIGAPTATPLTATQIAALFTDSATAATHVYVQVDTTNIGSVWTVTDAAGTAAGNVTAKLVGSIDLADTAWGTLTAANFA